jgi:hemolysin activation/secretion protein
MSFMGGCRSLGWAALIVAFATPAFAQSAAEPGHIDERFRPQPTAPSVGAPIEIPTPSGPTAPSDADKISFAVSSVSFEGNTVLPDSELQAIAAPYIGTNITLSQVYELADKVTAAYRAKGYVLVRAVVPAQKIDNGHLTLHIVNGFIDRVNIQGDAGGARPYLLAYGRRIAAIRPLTSDVMERELLLVSDLVGFQVRCVLTPSASVPEAADLTLVVDRKPVDAYFSFDNRGSKYLGPYEISGGVFVNDAFSTGGRLGLNAAVTPDSGPQMAYGGISFDQPVGTDGLRVFTTVSYAQTRPGSVLALLDTKGRAINGDMSWSYPFIRSRDFNLLGSAGVSYRDTESQNALLDPLYSDHVRSINAAVYINNLDDTDGYLTATARITQGLDILGATRKDSLNKSHVGASGDYTRGNFDASYQHPVIDQVSVLFGVSGQTSFGKSLLASEQYSLGGLTYDRAYDPSEVTGDSAVASKAELQYNIPTDPGFISGVQLYGFYEGGEVWQSHALPGTAAHQTLESAGAGVRFNIGDHMNADLEWADPTTATVVPGDQHGSRFYFVVNANL